MKKIMFNDKYGLTEAVLSGRKTQTRRIVPQSVIDKYSMLEDPTIIDDAKYEVGEVVAIAQSYERIYEGLWEIDKYEASHYAAISEKPGWTNKMFVRADLMPHRIRITDVKVERLQDISDDDCIKEGIGISATDNRIGYPIGIPFNYFVGEDKKGCRYSTPREAYAALIDKISGKGTWNRNPDVFAYGFELIK